MTNGPNYARLACKFLSSARRWLCLSAALLCMGCAAFATSLLVAEVSGFLQEGASDTNFPYLATLVLAGLLFSSVQALLSGIVSIDLADTLRLMVVRRFMSLNSEDLRRFHDVETIGFLAGPDIEKVRKDVIPSLLQICSSLVLTVFFLFKMASITVVGTVVYLAALVGIVYGIVAFSRGLVVLSKSEQDALSNFSTHFSSLGRLRESFIVFSETRSLSKFFEYQISELKTSNFALIKREALFSPLVDTIFKASLLGVFVASGIIVSNGWLEAKEIASFSLFVVLLSASLFSSVDSITSVAVGVGALKRVLHFLFIETTEYARKNNKKASDDKLTCDRKNDQLASRISDKYSRSPVGVRFDSLFLPMENREVTCDDSVRAGDFVVLTGASGVGKSSLLRLIAGLDSPMRGNIKFFDNFGKPINKINVGYFPQEFPLFKGSIRDNIAMLNSKVSAEKCWLALDQVGLSERIRDLGGLDAHIEEFDLKMSGGERQRLALCRLLVRTFDIILLDEVTSNLDSYSSKKILNALKKLDITVVLASHDAVALEAADKIVYM